MKPVLLSAALWIWAALPDPFLERARERLVADAAQMDRYTCRQTVVRIQTARKELRCRTCSEMMQAYMARARELPMVSWDRLRLDIAIADRHEIFSWAGAPKFEEDEILRIAGQGAFGTGDFGSYIASIFGPGATVNFVGEKAVGGRKLREYAYHVPLEHSRYAVRTPGTDRVVRLAHEGSFLLDSMRNDIVSLTVRSQELPEETGNCQTITEIAYGRVLIGSASTLVPRETRFQVLEQNGAETLNSTA